MDIKDVFDGERGSEEISTSGLMTQLIKQKTKCEERAYVNNTLGATSRTRGVKDE